VAGDSGASNNGLIQQGVLQNATLGLSGSGVLASLEAGSPCFSLLARQLLSLP